MLIEIMYFLRKRTINVDSNSLGMLCTQSVAANIISVQSHPRITIALRFTVIIHVPYGRQHMV